MPEVAYFARLFFIAPVSPPFSRTTFMVLGMRRSPVSLFLAAGLWLAVFSYGCRRDNIPDKKDTSATELKETLPPITHEITISADRYMGRKEMPISISHMNLALRPDFNAERIYGQAELTVKGVFPYSDSLVLDARGMEIKSVEADNQKVRYRYTGRRLIIYPPNGALKRGDSTILAIQYAAGEDIRKSQGIYPAADEQGLYFVNPHKLNIGMPAQLWTQGEPESNCFWFPTIETQSSKYTQELSLEVDTAFKTLSNGSFEYSELLPNGKRIDHYTLEKPHSSYLTMIAVGDWEIVEDQWRAEMPVKYYTERAFAPYAKRVFGKTPAMLEYFSKLLGTPYPWPEFNQVVVRNFVSGSMENTCAVVHGEFLLLDSVAYADASHEDFITHEMFHQWFGDLVTCEDWANLSVNEGFATLGEMLWREHAYGIDNAQLHRRTDYQYYLLEARAKKEPIALYQAGSPSALFDRHRYQKGGLVLHLLRRELTDSVFFQGLKLFLERRAYKTANFDHLRNVMEEVSGRDLHPFFHQWIERGGHPVIQARLMWGISPATEATVPLSETDSIIVSIKQTQQEEPFVFNMPLKFYYTDGTTEVIDNPIKNREFSRKLRVRKDVAAWSFDPDQDLPAEINEGDKSPKIQLFLAAHGGILEKVAAFNRIESRLPDYESLPAYRALVDERLRGEEDELMKYAFRLTAREQNPPIENVEIMQRKMKSAARPDMRYAAYSALRGMAGADKTALDSMALADPSYRMQAAALYSMRPRYTNQELSPPLRQTFLELGQNSTNGEVLAALAEYYAGREDVSAARYYFHRSMQYINGASLLGWGINYAAWLKRIDTAQVAQEVDFALLAENKFREKYRRSFYAGILSQMAEMLEKADAQQYERGISQIKGRLREMEQRGKQE